MVYGLAKSDISLDQQVCQEYRDQFLSPAVCPFLSPSRLLGFSFPSVTDVYLFLNTNRVNRVKAPLYVYFKNLSDRWVLV